jgi:ATP-dependent RNA helicase RhlE
VLAPTRELASQIHDSFRAYGRHVRLKSAVIYGGVGQRPQANAMIHGVDELVATPGRLLDLIDRGALTLSNVEILVLDEADRMLDLGFIHALKRIVKLLPPKRQTLLFSATMPRPIAELAAAYLNEPVKVSVAPAATTAERVEQAVMFVPPERKRDLLATMLRDPSFERVLVFTRTKHGADRVVRHLSAAGVEAAAIHGNKSQPQRERALAGFRSGNGRVLVATDIAARGIDVENVTHVINFELPNVPEDYVHRIGRTARAGAAGIAIAFCSDEEKPYLRSIEKRTRLAVPVLAMPAGALRVSTPTRPQSADPTRPATAGTRIGRTEPKQHPVSKAKSETAAAGSASLPAFLHRRPPATRASAVHERTHRMKRRIAN